MTRPQSPKLCVVSGEPAKKRKPRRTVDKVLPPLPNQSEIDMDLGKRCMQACRQKVA